MRDVQTCEVEAPHPTRRDFCDVYACPDYVAGLLRIGGGTIDGGTRCTSATVVKLCEDHMEAMGKAIQVRLHAVRGGKPLRTAAR